MEERGAHLPARRVPVRLMRLDVNVFLGAYPYRRVPGTSPQAVLGAMERVGIDEAWVTHLPSLFWQAPPEGNAWLYEATARERRFQPVPAVHPGLPGWEAGLGEARDRGAPRSEEHTSELQSQSNLVCRLLLEKKKKFILL